MRIQWSNPYAEKDSVFPVRGMTELRGTDDLLGCMSMAC